jgi:hypothetical protein
MVDGGRSAARRTRPSMSPSLEFDDWTWPRTEFPAGLGALAKEIGSRLPDSTLRPPEPGTHASRRAFLSTTPALLGRAIASRRQERVRVGQLSRFAAGSVATSTWPSS